MTEPRDTTRTMTDLADALGTDAVKAAYVLRTYLRDTGNTVPPHRIGRPLSIPQAIFDDILTASTLAFQFGMSLRLLLDLRQRCTPELQRFLFGTPTPTPPHDLPAALAQVNARIEAHRSALNEYSDSGTNLAAALLDLSLLLTPPAPTGGRRKARRTTPD